MNRKMMGNIAWNTFGSIFYSFCQWLMTVLVVYLASYIEAGYLSIAMTTSSSFSAIALFSMRNYQVSDVKGEYSIHEYFGSRLLTCALSFITCVSFSFIGNSRYMLYCICAFMVVRVAEAFADVLHGQDQKYDKYNYIGISYIIRGVATIAVFTLLMKITGNILVTLIFVAIINLAIALSWDFIKTTKLERIQPVLFSPRIITLLKCCVPLVVFSFLLSLENLVAKKALDWLSGTEALGIYSTIATPTLVVQVFAMVVFNPFLPSFSLAYQNGDIKKFKEGVIKLLIAFFAFFVITYLAATLLGRFALKMVFGEQILEYYSLFMPIIIVTLLTGYIWVLSAVLIGMRKTTFLLIAIALCFLINVVSVVPLIKQFDMNGASFAQILPHLILTILMIYEIIREIRRKSQIG